MGDFSAPYQVKNKTTGKVTIVDRLNAPSQGVGIGIAGSQAGSSNKAFDPIQQMLDLELQAIDAESGGSGGGGVHYSAGPAISSIQNYGRVGDQKLAELYAGLNDYLAKGNQATKDAYATGTKNVTQAYDQGSQGIKEALLASQDQINKSASLSPAGAGAAGDASAAATAAIQRQQSVQDTNKSNELATIQQLGTGHEAIGNEILAGAQNEGTAQRAKLQSAVAGMIANANASAAKANASSGSSASSNAGKTEAAKLRAMETALGRQTAQDQKTSGQKMSGIQGVLQYAQQAGHPELAQKFMQMLSAGRVSAADKNQQSMANPLIGKKTTDADQELQSLIGSVSGGNPNLNDPNTLIEIANSVPELSFLKSKIGVNPALTSALKKYPMLKQKIIDQANTDHKSMILQPLTASEKKKVQDYYDQLAQQQDVFGTMYDIYNGKF